VPPCISVWYLAGVAINCSTKQDDIFVVYVASDDASVLESKFKTEFLTVLSKHYKAATGRDMATEFRDS